MKKLRSPYRDKNGKVIWEGSYTRKHSTYDFPKQEYWIYEQVQFYKNDWYLFDVNYDYNTGNDEPHLLSLYHSELEVIDEIQVERNKES